MACFNLQSAPCGEAAVCPDDGLTLLGFGPALVELDGEPRRKPGQGIGRNRSRRNQLWQSRDGRLEVDIHPLEQGEQPHEKGTLRARLTIDRGQMCEIPGLIEAHRKVVQARRGVAFTHQAHFEPQIAGGHIAEKDAACVPRRSLPRAGLTGIVSGAEMNLSMSTGEQLVAT
jgi:hypothetical protein